MIICIYKIQKSPDKYFHNKFIKIFVGGDTVEGTPDSIPNSEVKLNRAEGSGNARIGNRRLFLESY